MAASGTVEAQHLSVKQLLENKKEDFLEATDILLKFANNILEDPNNPKFRRIRIGNHNVQTKLLPVEGAVECLFEMGFEEDGEHLLLPAEKCLNNLREIRDDIKQSRDKITAGDQKGPKIHSQPAAKLVRPQPQHGNIVASQFSFFNRLKSGFDHVLIYESPELQSQARAVIPDTRLRTEANKKYLEVNKESHEGDGKKVDKNDLFLLELLHWFKHDFFSWCDAPKCMQCTGATSAVGMVEPLPVELQWGASRVENYQCTKCKAFTRFPRYNHPGKLLETRQGRCGEWANCFTLCCRAMGFEARHVLDWTDHVWTEVYSPSQHRWLHCDPCENVCDKPLLYESGWGKQLSYVMAFSVDDIQDVTWRYSAKHQELINRRTECAEPWLLNTIVRMRAQRQGPLPEDRKEELKQRLLSELIEFLNIKTAGEGENVGRTTGSVAWRSARGELGSTTITSLPSLHVIKLKESEKSNKTLHLKYSCALDKYTRVSNDNETIQGWQAITYEARDVCRKEEFDWKMVYLARREGTSTATITWKFDFEGSGLVVDTVEILAESSCYEDGQVLWRVCSDDNCAILPPGGTRTTLTELNGGQSLSITANLRRGKGDIAWQHTQLFRQKMDELAVCPLEIKITLK